MGFLVVAGYAVFGAVHVLVWNPLAAVPSATLAQIHAEMDWANESLATPLVMTWTVMGILLAAGVLAASLTRKISAARATTLNLLLIVLGAPSLMFASFPAGMGIADTFGISGGDYAPWGGLLYVTSAVALVLLAIQMVRRRPKPAQTG